MKNFINAEYAKTIATIFHTVQNAPYDAKITEIRRYLEIVIRRLLDYPSDKKISIENEKENLRNQGFREGWFLDAYKCIQKGGNSSTHTQYAFTAQESDYDECIDALFTVYSYLFYKFFTKYQFGADRDIMQAFSTLPPIIRMHTLEKLFLQQPTNGNVAEKMVLATQKACGHEETIRWINSKKEFLVSIKHHLTWIYDPSGSIESPDIVEIAMINNARFVLAPIKLANHDNMFSFCKMKSKVIDTMEAQYSSFEEALTCYKEHGIVKGDSSEIVEFNDLMEFVFIGKEKYTESYSTTI